MQFGLVHLPSGVLLATVGRADGWRAKGWGVLGRRSLPAGQGLWLPEVASVHTVGVRFALDMLFLDREFRAVRLLLGVPPGRWLVRAAGAYHTLELGAGTLARLAPEAQAGDLWRLERREAAGCS